MKMRLYFVNVLLLWPLCAAEISQPVPFQTVKLGDSATIECHIKSNLKKRVWYKFTTGMGLQLVAAFNNFYNRSTFPEASQRRYSVKFDEINSHLSISATTWEDVGTYFCGVVLLNEIQFGSGTFLALKGSNPIRDFGVQQPESGPVQPGDSVTLSCSVHTGRCAAEHISVMWLKSSHHSAPPMIYYSGNKSCQMTESGETSCVYELLLRNLSSDDSGTFYCVLTSCGQTLFGNGTRIIVHKSAGTKLSELSPTVIALTLSNIILGIVTLILIWKLCKSQRKDSTETTDGFSDGNQTTDTVIYAPVCLAPRRFPTRQARGEYCEDSVVYSNLRYCQQNRQVGRQIRENED
ncbi:signal-regulatory protein beta-2-like [Etheostoma cragini]|uniref:signal-regulatory protein beta-2-like n=1 Tax=Etheostoma cragini TaxID=417921 RepID=UPI00155F2032|nr:signal-regulatory protein beta-2-like [Etheostoma cragini]